MRLQFFPKTISGMIRWYSVFIIGISLIFVTVMLIVFTKSAILQSAQQDLKDQVKSHQTVITEWFKERQFDVKFLAESDSVRSGNPERIWQMLKIFDDTHTDISAAAWADANGIINSRNASTSKIDVSDREYFIQGQAGNPHVTKVIFGRSSDKPVIIFSYPVTLKDGSFGGVIILASRLTAIDKMVRNLRFGSTGETYIVNREGYMLTESRFLDELKQSGRVKNSAIIEIKTSTKILEAALSGKQPQGVYNDYRRTKVIGSCQWVNGGRWLIISEIDYSEVMAPIYSFILTACAGAALALLILIPFSLRLVRSISIPLMNLDVIARQMTKGIFSCDCADAGIDSPPEEVERLIQGFCAMQNKVESTVQELQRSAITDQLTQLPNRRYLMKEGSRLLNIAIRAGQPCSIMILDIDRFKNINDTYGHNVGDIVLRQMSKTFQEIIRTSDIVARYGGEEFVVVAPGSDIESGRILAERLRKGIEDRTFNTDEQPLTCTISIGVAHYNTDIRFGVDIYEDTLARADEALYAAKNAGRNRVMLAEEQHETSEGKE